MIKTFRGLLNDLQQERIRLEHIDGKTGYRIKKFQLISDKPGIAGAAEAICKVYSIKQTVVDGLIDFSEQTLLAVATFSSSTDSWFSYDSAIFDGVTFNQDIFVTFKDEQANIKGNYYLELEQIALDDVEATAVILKNFRNTNTVA